MVVIRKLTKSKSKKEKKAMDTPWYADPRPFGAPTQVQPVGGTNPWTVYQNQFQKLKDELDSGIKTFVDGEYYKKHYSRYTMPMPTFPGISKQAAVESVLMDADRYIKAAESIVKNYNNINMARAYTTDLLDVSNTYLKIAYVLYQANRLDEAYWHTLNSLEVSRRATINIKQLPRVIF